MAFDHDRITEFDLLAYADGRLDAARRLAVEAHLARNPEARALVDDFVMQNEQLRRVLGPIAAEPVPARLKAVLEAERRSVLFPLLRAASVLALAATSGVGGWWLGASGDRVATAPPAFLAGVAPPATSTLLGSLAPLGEAPVEVAEDATLVEPGVVETAMPWFTDRVTVELKAPALGERFASPELQRLIEIDGKPTVRFELEGPDGRALALYLQTRPSTTTPAIHLAEEAGLPTAYWRDGPLLWALSGDIERTELEALAKNIGTAIELVPRLGAVDAEHTELAPPKPPRFERLPIELAGG